MEAVFAIIAVSLTFSLLWIVMRSIALLAKRNSKPWHYCAGCGCYIDPKGNPHDRMPYESTFEEVSEHFVTCSNHN